MNKNYKSEKELQLAILQEKAKGTPDLEIGKKYGVTFRYIEKIITKSQGINISALKVSKKIKRLYPKDFKEEQTTVWSFKQRGDWATHSGEYRGNWSPYIPRNVILKYSKPDELVLDYFCGAGTTAVEAKLLGRKCVALDINDKAIELAQKNVNFYVEPQQLLFHDDKGFKKVHEPVLKVGDARDLSFLKDNSIDLICAHPPYANIIHYTDFKEGDLSLLDIDDFLNEMHKVAAESFRVLKPGRQCAILVGDTRRKKHIIPLGFKLINVFLSAGFKLRELIIKRQHNCKTTGFWYENSVKYNFLLLAHEYLPIFEKPGPNISLAVREGHRQYGWPAPVFERQQIRVRLQELETTTVWILPERDFEERLNENVIERYSQNSGYSIINFISHDKNNVDLKGKKGSKNEGLGLIFIKSAFLGDNISSSSIRHYLNKIEEVVKKESSNIKKGGFLVIQTQDIRNNGILEPLGLRIVEMLCMDDLWLKEIVVVTNRESNVKAQNFIGYLKIIHKYLLIYEIKK